jgi:hypothetical protein
VKRELQEANYDSAVVNQLTPRINSKGISTHQLQPADPSHRHCHPHPPGETVPSDLLSDDDATAVMSHTDTVVTFLGGVEESEGGYYSRNDNLPSHSAALGVNSEEIDELP